jgi:hypothetical protein
MFFEDQHLDLPDDVLTPRPLMPGELAEDPILPRKPQGWRPDGIRWEAPKTRTCELARLTDHALIAVLARAWVLPLELVQPLVFPDEPLKSVQQRVRSFQARGLVTIGNTTNDTGKKRTKLLAASRASHDLTLGGGHRLPTGVEPFVAPADPTGAHLVLHLRHATFVAHLLLTRPSRIDEWRLVFPTLRNRRGPLGAVAELDLNSRSGEPVHVSVVPINDPFHERSTLTKIRDHLRNGDTSGRRPLVLVITPRVDEARRVLHYADTDLTIADQHDQPARHRTVVMPLNQLHRTDLIAFRLHPHAPDARDPDQHQHIPVAFLAGDGPRTSGPTSSPVDGPEQLRLI